MKTNQSLAKLTPDIMLSKLIAIDQEAGHMLSSIGLDPSEHKNETLRSVCKQRQWSEVEVLQWIKKHRVAQNGSANENDIHTEPDFGSNIVEWCNYLEENLHADNLELLSEIGNDFPRVMQIHGNQYPWLKNIKWHFEEFEEKLQLYLLFEEKKLFKLIKKLEKESGNVLEGTARELKRCLNIIKQDQKRLQQYMDTIREKGREFKNPPGACTTLRILNQNFKMLFENLEAQLRVEREKILPIVEQDIKGL